MKRIDWSTVTVATALAGAALLPLRAGAEIYGWVDPSGDVTYSNLPPPANARVIEVIPDTPPPSPQQRAAAAAAHDAEMKQLNDRVQQLERELRASRMEAPPYPAYGPPPAYAAAPSYGAPPPAPYPAYDTGPCDSDFFDCNQWDGPIYYTTGFAPWWGYRRRGFDDFHHHHHFAGPAAPHFAAGPVATHASFGHGGGHASGGGGHGR